jgi:SpoIIAA-like
MLGFEVNGPLHADDYRQVLLQPWRGRSNAARRSPLCWCSGTSTGCRAGALWQDLKLRVEHLTHWERIALVTDIDWMMHLKALFGWMTPEELKRFPLAEREAAIAWAAAGD